MLKNHKDLDVWQRSFDLCKAIYRLTVAFPSEERFGLVSQIRRNAVSIPSNIAEGYNRNSTRDYVRFLWIANGSIAELDTQLQLALELELGTAAQISVAIDELGHIERMLRALMRRLDEKP